jgi:glyoxylase-like metal-dependent hydrolase (beta-lactamase superfamily II)
MPPRIISVLLDFTDCYLIQEDTSIIMIDGGTPNNVDTFKTVIATHSIQPSDIKLIIVTHGHIDHIGSLNDIKTYTGAQVAVHHNDQQCLEQGDWIDTHEPKGVGRWFQIVAAVCLPILHLLYPNAPPVEVDRVISDEGLSLSEYGIHGRIVYTPGHTTGSLSVVLDSGEAFVGDLAMNKFPLRRSPGLPTLADDIELVKTSWRHLIDIGAHIVYPGHGKSFPIEVIQKALVDSSE